MKQITTLCLLFISLFSYANEPLVQNNYSREGFTLNGHWNFIVDVYESGYYNYRREPHDQSENPGADAFFINSKPRNKSDRVEYDFDAAPTLLVPGDWNSQKENLFYYEGTLSYKKSFDVSNFDASKRYFVHFGAVNNFAEVYLNGKKLGAHKGGFTPFNFEMNTDILKFFRYTQVPYTDAILNYQFGRDGRKLISSAADYYDRPLESTELYGAYKEAIFDSVLIYRSMMGLYARGVSVHIPHVMRYDPDKLYISPLVLTYSEKAVAVKPAYSKYVGRSSMMLQGGRPVSDIGVINPFEELVVCYHFENSTELIVERGQFNYIHKIKDGQHIYMFTNSTDKTLETEVCLQGNLMLESWPPHNKSIFEIENIKCENDG